MSNYNEKTITSIRDLEPQDYRDWAGTSAAANAIWADMRDAGVPTAAELDLDEAVTAAINANITALTDNADAESYYAACSDYDADAITEAVAKKHSLI